jgi:hypothetical protein
MNIDIPTNLRLSGLILFGDSELLVGLNNSQWLRVPRAAFPGLTALSGDEWLDFKIEEDYSAFRWPRHNLTLSLSEFYREATSIEDGDEYPK